MVMPLTVRRFSVDEYHRMAEAGILHEDDRVELLDGQIVQMTPIGPAHTGCVGALTHLLGRQLPETARLWVQNPVHLGRHEEPQPDLAVVRARPHGYRAAHPQPADILLLIEVADTSLPDDRERKIPLYARAGIPETWLVDLPNGAVLVYRQPTPSGYREVRTLGRGDTLTALHLPGVTLLVDDVLGPPS